MKIHPFTPVLIIYLFISTTLCFAQEHYAPQKRTVPSYLTKSEIESVKLYKKVLPTVITIFTSSEIYTANGPTLQEGLGSGVIVSGDNHILTAAHVVDGASRIQVKTNDGLLREAELLFSEQGADIALLKLKVAAPGLPHATLGDSDQLAIGQSVFAIGSPYGLENSFSSGIISGFRDFNQIYDGTIQVEFIQTDAAINSGNSGGPLFNSKGEVIGIASKILSVSGGFQGIGYVVAINTAKQLLAFEERPWIGIDALFLRAEEYKALWNIDIEGGLLVQKVAKGSPADKAGIRGGGIPANIAGQDILLGGDIILEFGPQQACHEECLSEAHSSIVHMDQIRIKLLRNGQPLELVIDASQTRKNFLSE